MNKFLKSYILLIVIYTFYLPDLGIVFSSSSTSFAINCNRVYVQVISNPLLTLVTSSVTTLTSNAYSYNRIIPLSYSYENSNVRNV